MTNKKNIATIVLFLKENKATILTSIFLSIIADIVFFSTNSDIRVFSIIFLYIASVWFYKFTSRLTFLYALCILALMFLLFVFTSTSENTEKAAVWLFFLIAIGIFQQFKE